MKLGIIGSGTIVQEFLPRLVQFEGLTVAGLQCTPRSMEKAQKLCRENQVPAVVTRFEDLCALDIDTVYVAVPNFLHYDYKKIRQWLPRIGTVKLVQSNYSQYSRRYDAFLRGEILPVFDPAKAGGALMDLGLYNLHFVMGLFGAPQTVAYYANVERSIDTGGVLTMQYDGFQAVCVAAKDCYGPVGATIQGTKGVIRTSRSPNFVGKVTLELSDGTREEYDDGTTENRLAGEFTEFIRAVRENDRAICAQMLEHSIAVSRVLTQARKQAGIRFPSDEF